MTFQVKLRHPEKSPVTFSCAGNETVYAAARRAGVQLATACLRGGCGACRSTVISGKVRELRPMSRTQCEDSQSGEITHYLLCVVGPASDLEIMTERPWQTRQQAALSERLGRSN